MSVFSHMLGKPAPLVNLPHLGEAHQIAASSATNVWVAVGNPTGVPNNNGAHTVNVYQWTGTAWAAHHYTNPTWEVAACGLLVFGPSDVWLFTGQTLARWNGSIWTDIWFSTIEGGIGAYGGALLGAASNDVWFAINDPNGLDDYRGVYHWDGTLWAYTNVSQGYGFYWPGVNGGPPPSFDGGNNPGGPTGVEGTGGAKFWIETHAANGVRLARPGGSVQFIAATQGMKAFWKDATTTCYLVGATYDSGSSRYLPAIYHGTIGAALSAQAVPPYYGSVSVPDPFNYQLSMFAVGGVSASDYWIGGLFLNTTWTLVLDHDVGGTWTHYDFTPGVTTGGTGFTGIFALKALATNDVWAVGAYYNATDNLNYTYVLHWDGSAWMERRIPATL